MASDPGPRPLKIHRIPLTINPRAVGGSETILIVEDEELQREMLSQLLSERGYKVLTASDGAEAVEIYRMAASRIALVILDIGLPRQSGVDAFHRIKEINPSALVAFATGYLETELKTQVMEWGARAFMTKPFTPTEILRMVRDVIDGERPR